MMIVLNYGGLMPSTRTVIRGLWVVCDLFAAGVIALLVVLFTELLCPIVIGIGVHWSCGGTRVGDHRSLSLVQSSARPTPTLTLIVREFDRLFVG
jgi:hypothetical protein